MPESPRVVRPTKVWHLELGELRPSRTTADVRLAEVPFGPLNRFLYTEVGRGFHWVDRLEWEDTRWQAWADQVETWLVYERDTPAGYAELWPLPDRAEVATFGLLEPFRGHGLGGALLTRVAERALQLRDRVTVNTCELDGPYARAHYEARGFRLAEERVEPRARSDLLH